MQAAAGADDAMKGDGAGYLREAKAATPDRADCQDRYRAPAEPAGFLTFRHLILNCVGSSRTAGKSATGWIAQ